MALQVATATRPRPTCAALPPLPWLQAAQHCLLLAQLHLQLQAAAALCYYWKHH